MSHTISYRLQSYDYQQTLKQARKSRCKSVHEYGRLALLSTLEEEHADHPSPQILEELSQLREESEQLKDEVSHLRLSLAKTLDLSGNKK